MKRQAGCVGMTTRRGRDEVDSSRTWIGAAVTSLAREPDGNVPEADGLWREAGRGFGRLFRASAGFEWWETPTATLALSGVGCPDLNCGLIHAGESVAADLAAMAGRLRQRGLPGLVLVPEASAAVACATAEAAEVVLAGRMPLMTWNANAVDTVPERFSVRRVATTADLSAANRLIAAAFELPVDRVQAAFAPGMLEVPGVRAGLVLDGDEPVGALQLTVAEGLTGIWSMATLPRHRRRGVARAALTHALASGVAEGCRAAFLIATDAGRPLYEAVGFSIAAWCDVWLVPEQPPNC